MLCNFAIRACARTHQFTLRLAAATLVVVVLGTISHAAMIGTYSLRFDGFVKQGANTGEEGHFNSNIPYISPSFPQHTLPANVDPPSPLLEARDLLVTETETAQKIIIAITNNTNDAKLGALFNNPLDLAVPVEWEANFAWTSVPANSKVNVTNITYVQANEANVLSPITQSVSGLGTVASPLKVLLTMDPNQFSPTPNNQIIGPFKVFLDYNFMQVPEPASIALGMLGMLGVAGIVGRRR
ncbi:MAG: PEP-CTERM sorting domain-containing protein [Pirellulales bacterium]